MYNERTTDLLHELNVLSENPDSFAQFRQTHGSNEIPTLKEYLDEYMTSHPGLQLSQIIFDSNSNKNYAHQFFNGRAKHPDKYKLITVCIAMYMFIKETDRSLFLAGQPKLYAKDFLKAALIICINRGYHTMTQVNEFLAENGLPMLGES